MIGFYSAFGSSESAKLFEPYLSRSGGIEEFFKKIRDKKYSSELDLVLIKYYVSGKHTDFAGVKPGPTRISKKDRSIGTAVLINIDDFLRLSEKDRILFLAEQTHKSISEVIEKLRRRKVQLDYSQLESDVDVCLDAYYRLHLEKS